jgi:GNAT superfamily N-acetyltransferase
MREAASNFRRLRSLNAMVRRLGLSSGLLWAASRTVSIASTDRFRILRYCFVAQPVPDFPLAPENRASAIHIRRVEAGDPLVAQFPRPSDVIADRFRMGAVCLAAETHDRFVGFLWIKESQYPEDEVRCHYVLEPSTGAVWDFDVYIDPAFRFGRTFARLWDTANTWLRERGYRWTLSRISAFNPDSLAAHRRLGIREVGAATFVRVDRIQIAFLDRAPFVHVGWRDDQAPTLRLRPPPKN